MEKKKPQLTGRAVQLWTTEGVLNENGLITAVK